METLKGLLYVTFIIYIIVMTFGYLFKMRWLYMVAGLLWLVPIFELENTFIVIISAIMLLAHGILAYVGEKDGDFE